METSSGGGSTEVSGRRLVRNTAANAAGTVVVALLAIVMTPLLLRRLGPAEYGVWLLATTLTFANGYLGIADLGLQQAGVRFIAEARQRGDDTAVDRVVSTLLVLFAVLGVLLGASVAALASGLVSVLNVAPSLGDTARLVFMLVGLQLAIDLPAAAFLAVIEGAQSYGRLRAIEVGGRLAWALIVVVVVFTGGGAVGMAVVSLGVAAAMLAVSVVLAQRAHPALRVGPRSVHRGSVASLARHGSALFVLRISGVVYRQMDRLIIGVTLSAAAVAQYEVAYKIHATAAVVLSIAPSAVMPAAAYLGAADDTEQLRSLYLRGTKYAVALAASVAIGALIYAPAIIATWVGAEYLGLTGATRLFLVYPIVVSVHVVGLTILVGLGRMREMVVLSPASIALNLVVSLVLVERMGLIGVVWGTLIGYLVLWLPYLVLMLRAFRVTALTWIRAIVLPNIPGAVLQIAAGVLSLPLVERSDQLWQVAAAVAANIALSLACFVFIVLRPSERSSLVKAMLRRGALPLSEPNACG